jgi:PAS domain-containing protein
MYAKLFPATVEPVLIVDAAYGSIIEANAAAVQALGTERGSLIGASLPTLFAEPSSRQVSASLGMVRQFGVARVVGARITRDRSRLNATLSLVRQGVTEYLLVRLELSGTESQAASNGAPSFVNQAIENGPTGFLVTDVDLQILYANKALLRMIEAGSLEEIEGEILSRWLELSRSDLRALNRQMSRRESVSVLDTQLYPSNDPPRWVQVLAIAVPDGAQSRWGFSISDRACLN